MKDESPLEPASAKGLAEALPSPLALAQELKPSLAPEPSTLEPSPLAPEPSTLEPSPLAPEPSILGPSPLAPWPRRELHL